MICRRCGAEMDTSRSVNGTLQCPSCGTVYQSRRAASVQQQSSQQGWNTAAQPPVRVPACSVPQQQSISQPSSTSENISNAGRRRRSAIYENTAEPLVSPVPAPTPAPESKPAPAVSLQPQRQATTGYVSPAIKTGPVPTLKAGGFKLPSGNIIAIVLAAVVAIGGITIVINNNGNESNNSKSSATSSAANITEQPTVTDNPLLKEVSDVLVRLQSAYNNVDIYGIMQCFDPGVSDGLFAGAKLLGLSNADTYKSLLPLGSSLLSIFASTSSDVDWPKCELTPLGYDGDAYRGVLTYNVRLTHNNGSVEDFDETLNIQKIDGKWYIC